jgi:dTDP-4-amino-4,6-dideoxygalactose transaminase
VNRLQTIPRFAVTYGARDFAASLGNLFRRHPPKPTALDELFPGSFKIWTGSGRQGLWLLLRALNLPPRAGVAVPLYSDAAVMQTVHACNLTPVFVDIDEQTLTMSPASLAKVRNRVSAIVAVHLFGHVAPIRELQNAAPGIPLIEDTVHSPFSYLEEKLTGTMGIGCFFSLGSSKCWPAGGGGVAVIHDPLLAARVSEDSANLKPQPLTNRISNILFQTAKALLFRRPMYGAITRSLRPLMERYALLEPALDLSAIQPGQAAVAVRQMKSYPARVECQRRNSERLLSRLRDVPNLVLPYERAGARYNYHFFPVLVSDAQERDGVSQWMLSKSVDTSRVYFNVIAEARRLGYDGTCPVAESAPERMLTLPNYSSLRDRDIDYIAQTFIQSLDLHRAQRSPNVWTVRSQETTQIQAN